MTRLLTATATALALLTAAIIALSAIASANPPAPTPLELEPAPITAATDTIELHQQTPEACTPLTTGLCLETVNTWACPAGLSADAKQRLAPTYAENIANPQPYAVAYLDTHCTIEQTTRITPGTWLRLTGGTAVPDAYVDSAGNVCRNLKNTVGDVVNIVCTAPGTQPTPAFTG